MTDNEIIKALEGCSCDTLQEALDLINRQKTEIERLNNNMDSMVAEHERLIKNAKSEAIREFAEKLKDVFVTIDGVFECSEIEEHIDNLVKEMVGEDNGTA